MDSDKKLVVNLARVKSAVEARTGKQPTNAEIAKAVGITYQGLNKWEKYINIRSFVHLKNLSEFAGVPIDEILVYDEEK